MLWSTLHSSPASANVPNFADFSFELSSDGYLYGVISYGYNSNIRFWKVDAATGEFIWSKTSIIGQSVSMKMCSNDKFAITYIASSYMYSAIISTATGDTLQTRSFGITNFETPYIGADHSGNVYFAVDGKLSKFNGSNLKDPLWNNNFMRSQNDPEIINRIYVDNYGDIYLFCRSTTIIKINPDDGSQIWKSAPGLNDIALADFVDRGGYFYSTYQHIYVGGGTYYFATAKIHKQTGTKEWQSNQLHTPVGQPASHSGNQQSALAIAVDCAGDVYLTGYYGDANSGPEAWGTMKLNGVNGHKIYDLTITLDSAEYDNYSSGLGICMFDDTPYLLGILEYAPNKTKPALIKLEGATGKIDPPSFIPSRYEHFSATMDMIHENKKMYVLKQKGEGIVVESYDSARKLIWARDIKGGFFIHAKSMKIGGTEIYVAGVHPVSVKTAPYYLDQIDKIYVYRLNKATGALVRSDSLTLITGDPAFMQLHVEQGAGFVFYRRSGNVYGRKVINGFFPENLIENGATNSDYAGGLTTTQHFDTNDFLYAGSSAVYKLSQVTLAKTTVFTYPANHSIYGSAISDSILYLAGNDLFGTQKLLSINIDSMTLNWERQYSSGSLYKVLCDSSNIYTIGGSGNASTSSRLSSTDGSPIWTFGINDPSYSKSTLLDLALNTKDTTIVVGASLEKATGGSAGFIAMINKTGTATYVKVLEDTKGEKSFVRDVAAMDSMFWIGGSINTLQELRRGFIYLLKSKGDSCQGFSVSVSANGPVTFCQGDSVVLASTLPGTWSNGTTGSTITVRESGFYHITVSNGLGCTLASDSIQVIVHELPAPMITKDGDVLISNAKSGNQWFMNNTPIPGATDTSYTVPQPVPFDQCYHLEVTSDSICRGISDTICFLKTTGLDMLSASGFDIYPNPSHHTVQLKFSETLSRATIAVVDMTGRIVLEHEIANGSIVKLNISELNAGSYTVRVNKQQSILYARFVKL